MERKQARVFSREFKLGAVRRMQKVRKWGQPRHICYGIVDPMPRQARVVAEGVPHHITQRGNNRQEVFLLDEDRRFYLDTLQQQTRHHGVRLLGWCLMTNHVHLIAVPERPDALALALGQLHGSYARRFNRRYQRSGHLWQNRFYSCPLGRTHLGRALLYVDLNPVRAGLVSDARSYPWSSAAAPIRASRAAAARRNIMPAHPLGPRGRAIQRTERRVPRSEKDGPPTKPRPRDPSGLLSAAFSSAAQTYDPATDTGNPALPPTRLRTTSPLERRFGSENPAPKTKKCRNEPKIHPSPRKK